MSAHEIFDVQGILFPLHDELWKNFENKIWELLNEANCILVRTTIKRIYIFFGNMCI